MLEAPASPASPASPAAPAGLAGLAAAAAPVVAGPGASWVVRPGDTLSGIAAGLGVRGGWPALHAANRRVIGADPGLIRPGAVLAVPGGQRPAGTRSRRVTPSAASPWPWGCGRVPGLVRRQPAGRRPGPGPDPPGGRPGRAGCRGARGGARAARHRPPPASQATLPGPRGPAAGSTPSVPAVPGSASPAGLVPLSARRHGQGAGGVMPAGSRSPCSPWAR